MYAGSITEVGDTNTVQINFKCREIQEWLQQICLDIVF